MTRLTKLVRSIYESKKQKGTPLGHGVGVPFWAGFGVGLVSSFYILLLSLIKIGFVLICSSLLIAAFVGILAQVTYDLYVGLRGGAVRIRYVVSIGLIFLLGAAYGMVYYRTPESGVEKIFLMGSMVVVATLLGYLIGKADDDR